MANSRSLTSLPPSLLHCCRRMLPKANSPRLMPRYVPVTTVHQHNAVQCNTFDVTITIKRFYVSCACTCLLPCTVPPITYHNTSQHITTHPNRLSCSSHLPHSLTILTSFTHPHYTNSYNHFSSLFSLCPQLQLSFLSFPRLPSPVSPPLSISVHSALLISLLKLPRRTLLLRQRSSTRLTLSPPRVRIPHDLVHKFHLHAHPSSARMWIL